MACLQDGDVDKAMRWLSVACKNNLVRVAAKAERFLVQADADLSGRQDAEQIPHSSMLRMLDSRRTAIMGMWRTAKSCATIVRNTNLQCGSYPQHPVAMPRNVEEALAKLVAIEPDYPNVELD